MGDPNGSESDERMMEDKAEHLQRKSYMVSQEVEEEAGLTDSRSQPAHENHPSKCMSPVIQELPTRPA